MHVDGGIFAIDRQSTNRAKGCRTFDGVAKGMHVVEVPLHVPVRPIAQAQRGMMFGDGRAPGS